MSTWKTAGKVRMTPKGTWSSSSAYEILDCVTSTDGLTHYIAKQAVPAGTLLTNTDYWDVVVDTSGSLSDMSDALDSMNDTLDNDVVRVDEVQTLNDTKKVTARTNIGAASASDVDDLKSAIDERQVYARKTFNHVNGTAHSSLLDRVSANLESGKTYVFSFSDTASGVSAQVYVDSVRLFTYVYQNILYEFTPSDDYEHLSVYVSQNNPTGTLTFEVYEKDYALYKDIDSVNAKIDAITDDLYGASVYIPEFDNGTISNPANADAVHTVNMPVQAGDIVEISVKRALPTGHVYSIGYTMTRSAGAVVTVQPSETTNTYVSNEMVANTVSIGFNIFELDGTGGNRVPIRVDDFNRNDFIVKIIPREGSYLTKIDDAVDNISELQAIAAENVVVSPVISNGSGGNPGNVNGVTARAVPFKGAYAITFTNKHPLKQEGNYYKYDISAFRGTAWYTNLITGVLDNTFTFHAQDIIRGRTDVDGFGITIWEYDSNDAFVSIRNTDFDPAEFIVRYTYQLEEDANNIVNRNEDMRLAVYASSNYGHNGQGRSNVEKVLSMLAVADIHAYPNLLSNASKYLDAIPSLDCGIVLGDIMAGNYAESDGTWYTNIINDTSKIIYTVIGNHDGGNSKTRSISGTKQEVFNKFIAPVKAKMGMVDLTKTYYSVNFSAYKITMIVLNNYDSPDTISGDSFVVSRGAEVLSQEQVNWFISTLNAVPSDYTVVVVRHSSTGATWNIFDCAWTKVGSYMGRSEVVYDALPVNDIVHAWQTGGSLNRTYNPTATGLPTLTVSCDFSSRGIGKFACYLFGHSHCDTVAYDEYGNLGVQFDTASSGNSQPGNSDLPRIDGIKSEDCVTVVSIDTYRSLLKLVRIGSNVSMDMVDRKYIALPFHNEVT